MKGASALVRRCCSMRSNSVKDEFGRLEQGMDYFIRLGRFVLGVAVVDKNRAAARGPASMHVPPAIADHEARSEFDSMLLSRLENHARLGLATHAMIAVGVKARLNVVDGQQPPELSMHRFDRRF